MKKITPDPSIPDEKALKVSANLNNKYEAVLIYFLCANADMFAWSPSDMPGIPREVTEDTLEIQAGSRLVKQRLRRFDQEKCRIIGSQIHQGGSSS
jgi:hypothetical protein